MEAFRLFLEKLRKGIADYYGEAYRVEINEIQKNNGIVYRGVTITSRDSNLSPTIYTEQLYEQYKDGRPLSGIVQEVIRIYEDNKIEGGIDEGFFADFSQVRERIVCKLINYEKNRELLASVPYVRFLNLALVCYCSILHDTFGSATILVRWGNLKLWGVDERALFDLAVENTRRILTPQIRDMDQIMSEEDGELHRKEGQMHMYVLTNNRKLFGAVCILYPEVLRQFSRQISKNFYILPSSVHEVILIPEEDNLYGKEFEKLVRSVNRMQVEPEEVLSDSVYYYDRAREKITIL